MNVDTLEVAAPTHVPRELIVDLDVYNPAALGEDFHAAWVRIQKTAKRPLVWSPRYGGHWIAMGGEDILNIYRDHERFSSAANTVPPSTSRKPLGALHMDPPQHAPFRAFLNDGLSPKVVRGLAPGVRTLAIELIDSFKPRGGCEFIGEFANVLPLTVFLNLVDLPLADRNMLAGWASAATHETGVQKRDAASRAIRDYLVPVILERRRGLGEDMLSRIVHAKVDGRSLTNDEAVAACTHLLIAGLDTVSSMLGFVMRFLASNPDHRLLLIREPERIPSAVKELIRRFPLVVMAREVRADTDFQGVTLKGGDMIVIPTMLFNLDERQYPDPLAVEWDRPVLGTCTFGAGVHRCPGAALGLREVAIALEEWLIRIPEFHVDESQPITVNGGIVATIDRLPLRW